MIIDFFIAQLLLVAFNIANVKIDAYKIFLHKTIAHTINLSAYAGYVVAICVLSDFFIWPSIVFSISAFFNRQLSFDIPLNLRRKLPWYYQTKDNSSKASLLDRLERRIFGNGESVGKTIAGVYFGLYAATITIFIIWKHSQA